MFKVKICGITNLQDALEAVNAGADALGFVFYENSPRYIEPKYAKEISKALPPFVHRVGLFVNKSAEEINAISHESLVNSAQIHFDAKDSLFDKLEVPHIKVIRAKNKEDIYRYPSEYKIVDAFVESYGGEGKRVDQSWFEKNDNSKIILAGGLNQDNVKELKSLGFYGFDVSSGVERAKGLKDTKKIKEFIKRVKFL